MATQPAPKPASKLKSATADKAKASVKHLQLSKSQSTILGVTALAIVLVIFGLFATKAMITKGLYQRRVLHARQQVVSELKANYTAAQTLVTQYKVFASEDPNMLGGSASSTTNPLDGDNATLALDALPSKYDAPALASSIEKILQGQNVTIDSISVTDDPASNSDAPVATPSPMPMTFSFEGTTNYKNATKLLQDFERSIRPFDLNTLEIAGTDSTLHLTVGMTTYFQPAKSLNLTPTKEVQ
ncbi:MAG TPA: hypothetical protein VHD84_02460 [Candidatus Saccharimonadales bacterium]|nr:hypothetical protein [Candidatus Saccharimonadales bacterium]